MKFMIEIPEDMLNCKATEAITICLEEQANMLVEMINERL